MDRSGDGSLDVQIGLRIKQLRQNNQLSEIQVAARLGMPLAEYRSLEDGRTRANANTLLRLSVVLNTTVANIYAGIIP